MTDVSRRDRELLAEAFTNEPPRSGVHAFYEGGRSLTIGMVKDAALRAISQARIEEREAVEPLREALQVCANKFWEYVILHEAKRSPEGDEKAARNREMAEMCEGALKSGDHLIPVSDDGRDA